MGGKVKEMVRVTGGLPSLGHVRRVGFFLKARVAQKMGKGGTGAGLDWGG